MLSEPVPRRSFTLPPLLPATMPAQSRIQAVSTLPAPHPTTCYVCSACTKFAFYCTPDHMLKVRVGSLGLWSVTDPADYRTGTTTVASARHQMCSPSPTLGCMRCGPTMTACRPSQRYPSTNTMLQSARPSPLSPAAPIAPCEDCTQTRMLVRTRCNS